MRLDIEVQGLLKSLDIANGSILFFIEGLARDDSGELLNITKNHGRAPSPLEGCEKGLVHLYGPYFHWACG